MATPLSNCDAHRSVPERYVVPVDKRPGRSPAAACEAVPVIDLNGEDRDMIVKRIADAGKEFGFFQIVNHGVPEEVMNNMMSTAQEFFNLPNEEKMLYYSTDRKKFPRFHTSSGTEEEKVLYWRDCLRLACYPLEDFKHQWPEKPHKLREILEAYTMAVRAVALQVLRLTAVGLGLEEGYFDGQLSAGVVLMHVNHYVPCPDPSLTLGISGHCDPNLMTVLMQGDVSGLQVLYKRDWLTVEPVSGAFVVNFGHQLEIISNGIIKSVEHRAVTNMSTARTSLATFIQPTMDCIVTPALASANDNNPPLYKSFSYHEFVKLYLAVMGDRDTLLGAFQIQK